MTADVVVGSLDFTVILVGTADPIAVCRDRFVGEYEMLAGLFGGDRLTGRVAEQYETLTVPAEAVLVPNVRSSPSRCGATIWGRGWWPRRFIGCCPRGWC